MSEIVATDVVASWPPELQPTGTPTARANNTAFFILAEVKEIFSLKFYFKIFVFVRKMSMTRSIFEVGYTFFFKIVTVFVIRK